jgi:hypothetical protein
MMMVAPFTGWHPRMMLFFRMQRSGASVFEETGALLTIAARAAVGQTPVTEVATDMARQPQTPPIEQMTTSRDASRGDRHFGFSQHFPFEGMVGFPPIFIKGRVKPRALVLGIEAASLWLT